MKPSNTAAIDKALMRNGLALDNNGWCVGTRPLVGRRGYLESVAGPRPTTRRLAAFPRLRNVAAREVAKHGVHVRSASGALFSEGLGCIFFPLALWI
jgi:hypothetical protein